MTSWRRTQPYGRDVGAAWQPGLLLALVAVLIAGCGAASSSHSSATAENTSTSSTDATRFVYMRNHSGADEFAYAPHTITIRTGTRVTWINRSVQPHTVTAKGRSPAFDSGTTKLIQPKGSWSFLFRHPGRYPYYCLLHPYMTGVVIVRS